MGATINGTYMVERLDSEQAVAALQESWSALLADLPSAPVFVTWEWVHTWWRHYGRQQKKLWVLAVRDADGGLVGVAPWQLAREGWGPLCVRKVSFLGTGLVCPAHLGIVATPAEQAAVAEAISAFLVEHGKDWDVIDLEDVDASSALRSPLAATTRHMCEDPGAICPIVPLTEDWDSYHGTLSKKLRRNLRYFASRLEREHPGKASFYRVTEPDELSEAMDSLIEMHKKRREDTAFNSAQFVAFHREMASLGLERDWLRFYQLRVGDQAIAAMYCYRFKDTCYAYQIGFDIDWSAYSPGRLLIAHVIEQAIEEDCHSLDWLCGASAYKYEWTDQDQGDVHLVLAKGVRGQAWMGARSVLARAKELAKNRIPEPLQERINVFLAARRS